MFTTLLDKVEKSSEGTLPHKAKMIELNKARVGFKHYGNLPASSEAEKFRSYTYDFLVVASQRYLEVDFEKVSLSSLISDPKVRNHIEAAEKDLAFEDKRGSFGSCSCAILLIQEAYPVPAKSGPPD